MVEVLVGFGANVGDVRTTLGQAVDEFCDGTAVRLLARSSDYRTPPWGEVAQPAFVNLCIAAETDLPAPALLQRALVIERRHGRDRQRERRWGPRTLDIDLLAYGDQTIETPDLTLPHPRLFERAFVLVPLAEIRPDLLIGGRSVAAALEGLDRNGIVRLPAA
jgi:2-amino-4-hydroxy-6-hydroxymethyldihydropteridine diphosphokinase